MNAKSILALSLAAIALASCGKEPEAPKKRLSFAVAETGTVTLSE